MHDSLCDVGALPSPITETRSIIFACQSFAPCPSSLPRWGPHSKPSCSPPKTVDEFAPIKSAPGEIDRIVFLGAAPNLSAEKLKSRSLFIFARDDCNDSGLRLPGIRAQYEKAPQPKELIVLDGSAHAQFLFQTDQSTRVMQEILRFLSMP